MALTKEDQQYVRDILIAFYGREAAGNIVSPTEETLLLTEELLLRIYKCNKLIKLLLHSVVPTGAIGRGFLRKHLRKVAKVFTSEIDGFSGCRDVVGASLIRTQIFESTW